ncbi:MAG: hypothetical protein ACE5HL_12315, partial [Terriglobia bacterium]
MQNVVGQLEVSWKRRWAAAGENLRALFLRRVPPPDGFPREAWFQDACVRGRLRGQALVLSAVLHVLFVVTP